VDQQQLSGLWSRTNTTQQQLSGLWNRTTTTQQQLSGLWSRTRRTQAKSELSLAWNYNHYILLQAKLPTLHECEHILTSNTITQWNRSCFQHKTELSLDITREARIAQWLECWTRVWKVMGSSPCGNGGIIFFSRVNFLCWLLFQYLFHPCVTTLACKRSWLFCQKCRWQVITKHACIPYICGFAWSDMVHACMVYTECTETVAVSCGTSHVSTVSIPLWWIIKNFLYF